jgi:hypothetical protein
MYAMLLVSTVGECWNVIGLVGLSTMTPHLAYICTMLEYSTEYSPIHSFTFNQDYWTILKNFWDLSLSPLDNILIG